MELKMTTELTADEKRICREAADYIEKYGHWKGAYFGTPTEGQLSLPACAMGAMYKKSGSWSVTESLTNKLKERATSLLADRMELPLPRSRQSLPFWNDTSSAEEVISRLREWGSE